MIPLSLVGIVGGGVISGVVFIASLGFSVAQHSSEIASLQALAKERHEQSMEYERNVSSELGRLKADVSVVDTRVSMLSDLIRRFVERDTQQTKRGK